MKMSLKLLKVIVIGKGYGANQIVGSYSSGWVQGDQEKVVIDKAVNTTTEANNLAQKYYNIYSKNRVDYTFEYIGIDDFTTGDVITLNSDVAGVYNTDLRITKQKFVATKNEEMIYLTVRGTSERENADDYLKKLLETKKANAELASFNQPVDTASVSVSVTGGIISGPSITSISGSVDYAGAADNGYFWGNYQENLTGDDDGTWYSVGTSINTGSYEYFFHGVFSTLTFMLGSDGVLPGFDFYLRVYNVTDGTYYPNSTGLKYGVNDNETSSSHRHRVTVDGTEYNTTYTDDYFRNFVPVSTYIHIPYNWTNKTYRLQYKIPEITSSGIILEKSIRINYSYHATFGHTHGDSFDTLDSDHPHDDDLSGSAADHTHGTS